MLLLLFFCRMLIALHPCNIWMKRREVCSTTKSDRVQGRSQQPKSIHGFLGKKKKKTTMEVTACWVWGFSICFLIYASSKAKLNAGPGTSALGWKLSFSSPFCCSPCNAPGRLLTTPWVFAIDCRQEQTLVSC